MLELLLARGVPVNATEPESGATAIYDAASMGRTEAVAALLAHGADPNLVNKDGHAALHAASSGGFAETAEVLRKHGALDDPALVRKVSNRR